ncbi:MAG: mannose-1-phosphate guanylyltransferase [Planctomycetota bacterium]|jgi:mannose-1-phosphate guanylyltransferase
MNYAIVMAGGTGKRLWPLSRKKRPKQILKILDGQTLLHHCFDRLAPIFDLRNIIVLTNENYIDLVKENLPELPPNNIIAEPAVRDTAGAIGLAATILSKQDPDATMAVVTADQVMKPIETFQTAFNDALDFVNNNPNCMITFGVKPAFASTQFGYINCTNPEEHKDCKNKIYTVAAFKEKPGKETAKKYIESGQYFWNAGMFVWKARTILDNLENFLPESTELLEKIKADWATPQQNTTLNEYFLKLPKISIDYAVMEKAKNVHAIKLDCQWLDLGAFDALADFIKSDKNHNIVVAGLSELLDCKNSIIVTEDDNHLIAAIGLENVVIAHTPDATFVSTAKQAGRLKELLEQIEKNTGEKFL